MGKECILSFHIQRNLMGRYFPDNDRTKISGEREGRIKKKAYKILTRDVDPFPTFQNSHV